ncbi:MAG TPA: DUF2130 domain-containing protein [Patescibacteria group bacterium]|nr:DUF2130 domain-containing protein [Patescibacteria group bacterium]
MNNLIKCIHCGREFEISEALKHDLEEKIKKDVVREVSEKQNIELVDLKKQLDEEKKKNDEFIEKELDLRKKTRELEDKEKNLELETARKIDAERKKIEEKVLTEEAEKTRLKNKEKDEQIDNLKRMLEEANRKASQTSQQIQGEVLEVDLEEKLRSSFPTDIIEGVGKGVRGGDIMHTVKNTYGKTSGIILWETKRASWSPSWLPKLRDDSRKAGASLSVLVSEELPKDIKTFGVIDGVLVTGFQYCLPLAFILRRQLNAIFQAKQTTANKDEKLEKIYQYLQSDMFRNHIEAFAESAIADQQDLETEKRSMQRVWKKREMQIQRTIENITNMYGELQGMMGNSLPDIKTLSLPSGDEEI